MGVRSQAAIESRLQLMSHLMNHRDDKACLSYKNSMFLFPFLFLVYIES